MATTTEYLNQLKSDKQALVNNLVSKGVQATNDETFTSLVPKVLDVQSGGGKYAPKYLSFYRCTLNEINEELKNLDTSNITNMSYMFNFCQNLTSLDLSGFDTSNVTNMIDMFANCSSLTSLDLSNFNTSKVTSLYNVFSGCNKLTSLDLSGFDTSNVTNLYNTFYNCSSLTSLDLSNFNTSKVTNMYATFNRCSHLQSLDISSFDFSKVTMSTNIFGDVPKDCLITVKDQASKDFVLNARSDLTNVVIEKK